MNEKQKLILVIDDEVSIRDSFRDYLEDRDFRVLTAENGRAGLDLMAREAPDLLLVDLRMPKMGGLEVLERTREAFPDLPAIVVSGTGVIADAVEALHRGAWDYLLKPIKEMAVLGHAVANALEKSRLKRENRAYREHLEAEVARRTRELSELNARLKSIVDSTRSITACPNLAEMGRQLLKEFAANMAAQGGSLYLVEGDKLVLKHSLDRHDAVNEVPLPPAPKSVLGHALTKKQPVLIRDIGTEKSFSGSGWSGYLDGSLLTFPLFDQGQRLLGVVTLHNKTYPPFTGQDCEIGTILASYSCEAIRAAQTLATLHHKADELAVLNSLGRQINANLNLDMAAHIALEHAHRALGPDLAFLFQKAGDELVLKCRLPQEGPFGGIDIPPHRVGKCLCGLAVQARRPVFSSDIFSDPRCTLEECKQAALPLMSGEKVIGVLGVASVDERDFSRQAAFLEALVGEIAIGFKNAILYEQAEADAAKLQTRLQQIKQAEKEKIRLSMQVQQTQRMEAIGTLAGGIAHDFNNILSGIIGYTELALHELPPDDTATRGKLEHVLTAGERAADLVRQILQFSRKESNPLTVLPLTPILKEAVKFIRSTLPATIAVEQKILTDRDRILAEATHLHQIILNLCTNAYHAMRERGGTLTVTLRTVSLAETKRFLSQSILPGQYVTLSVGDTGGGIAPGVIDRIFEPYFTTKDASDGTGLGLSVIFGIVSNHQGLIEVDSSVGKGAVFTIYLPLASAETQPVVEDGTAPARGNNERILVVDDEAFFLDVTTEHLERLGYRVTGYRSSAEALEAFSAQAGRFDLIVTDLTMPQMTGVQLSSEIRKLDRNVPVVLCTGYSQRVNEQTRKHYGIQKLLLKPVSRGVLAKAVSELLAGAGT